MTAPKHRRDVSHAYLVKIGCDDVVGPEGMEKFCEDIGVEPENVRKVLFLRFSCAMYIVITVLIFSNDPSNIDLFFYQVTFEYIH